MRRAVSAALLMVTVAVPASAGGVRDLATAWLVDGPRTIRLLDDDDRRPNTWWLEIREGTLFGLAELPQVGLHASRDGEVWRLSVWWERLGSRLYREDIAGVVLARRSGDWLVGATMEFARLSLGTRPGQLHPCPSIVARWDATPDLEFSLHWPLAASPPWFGDRGVRPWIALAGRGAGAAWTLDVSRRGDATPVVGGEALFRLAHRVAWGWRWDGASGSLGLVTAWRRGGLLIRSSHLAHRDLGLSHRWAVGVGR